MLLPKRKVLLWSILIILDIAIIESVLSLTTFFSPRITRLLKSPWATPNLIDPRLGNRPNPDYMDHDSRGYRNWKAPSKIDTIVFGDSQTYGNGVSREEAWPCQLEALIQKPVYNMSLGGYGPGHYLLLWHEAAELKPTTVIVGFYAGNDLFDSYDIVYSKGQLSELKSTEPVLQKQIKKAESIDPLQKKVMRSFNNYSAVYGNISAGRTQIFRSFHDVLRRSKLYGLLRRIFYEFFAQQNTDQRNTSSWLDARQLASTDPSFYYLFERGGAKTVFTIRYRFTVLDPTDPRILEGYMISLRAFKRMNELARESSIRFLVVLIPTKETAFRKLWAGYPSDYKRLVEKEEEFWAQTKKFMAANGIEYVDTLPFLEKQFNQGAQPYFVDADGHPNKSGHHAVAESVAEYLKRAQLQPTFR